MTNTKPQSQSCPVCTGDNCFTFQSETATFHCKECGFIGNLLLLTSYVHDIKPSEANTMLIREIREIVPKIWYEVADSIPGIVGSMAMKCRDVRFEKPNVFIVAFDSKTAKDMCERESERLQNALSQAVGTKIVIRCELPQYASDIATPHKRPKNEAIVLLKEIITTEAFAQLQ